MKFTDKTFTSSTSGVKSWAWDFDGDNKIDSTNQNPKWTFAKTTWDRQWDVTLTTTDGVHPTSKLTKRAFITVDPSDAFAVDFGVGSTNKPVPTPIELPLRTGFYNSSSSVRGFSFVAPTTIVITAFEAPNDWTPKESHQTVTCYVLPSAPSGSFAAKAGDIRFHGTGLANSILKPTKPIVVLKGQWVGVVGACHASTSKTLLRNSRGPGPFMSTVLGRPITLAHLYMNSDPRVNKGLGTVVPSTGILTRVHIHVAGNTTVPILTTIGVPRLGTTAKLDMQAKDSSAQGGLVILGAGRQAAPVTTPFGNMLIKLPFFGAYAVATGTGQHTITIPNDNRLKGIILDFQGLVFNVTTSTFGMTNGTEWFLGR